jgi:hypothetical protein
MADRPSTPPPLSSTVDEVVTPKANKDGQEDGLRTPGRAGEDGYGEGLIAGVESPSIPASMTTTTSKPPNLVSKPTISTPMSTTGHAGVTGGPSVSLSPVGKGAATVGLGAGGSSSSSPLKQAKKGNPTTKSRKPLGDLTSGSGAAQSQAQAQAQAQADEKDPTRQGKGKDLSHVPCRFYKMGVCAAGDGCVFSHSGVDSECRPFEVVTLEMEERGG